MKAEAEQLLIQRTESAFRSLHTASFSAFSSWQSISDSWVEEHPHIFESIDSGALFLLPRFLVYVLTTFRTNRQTSVYINLLRALGEYGKCKDRESAHLNLKYRMTESQLAALLAVLRHLRYNQPANIDKEELDRIIKNWGNRNNQ